MCYASNKDSILRVLFVFILIAFWANLVTFSNFPLGKNTSRVHAPRDTPKVLWVFWDSGVPEQDHIRGSFDNWALLNPTWEIRLLTNNTLSHWLSLHEVLTSNTAVTLQSKSDLVGIIVLARHGGIYVDADVFGVLPFDAWLPKLTEQSGFFAFTLVGRERLASTWFLASFPSNYIATTWRDAIFAHVLKHGCFEEYFQLRYEFNRLLNENALFSALWKQTLIVNATISSKDQCCVPMLWNGAHVSRVAVQAYMRADDVQANPSLLKVIDSNALPVIKCDTFKRNDVSHEGTILNHLNNRTEKVLTDSSLHSSEKKNNIQTSELLVINLGFPKTGTTSLTSFLNSHGLNCAHWRVCIGGQCDFIGPTMFKQHRNREFPLSAPQLTTFNCFSQMDYCGWLNRSKFQSRCYWPQFDMLEELFRRYPRARYILTSREPTKWLSSARQWGDLLDRIRYSRSEGLRYGAFDEEILNWYISRNVMIRNFFSNPSRLHKLFEFHQVVADATSENLIKYIFLEVPQKSVNKTLKFPKENVQKQNLDQ